MMTVVYEDGGNSENYYVDGHVLHKKNFKLRMKLNFS